MTASYNLVIQTAFLGDLILSVPVLKRIKKIFPQEKLIIVCKRGLGGFLTEQGIVDDIIEIEKSNSDSYKTALDKLTHFSIKNIFCLHRSVRSQLFVSKIRAEKKIGFSSFLGFWIFDDTVSFRKNQPEVIRQFAILEPVDPVSKSELHASDFSMLNSAELPEVPEFFSFQNIRAPRSELHKIAIFPGSVWPTKMWTKEGFTELTKMLLKNNFQVDLLGTGTEKKLCEEIAAGAAGAEVLAGQFTVAETISNLSKYDLIISNDSAPTHMAAYCNIPVISIFGPTVLSQGFRPWSNNSAVVENKNLDCRPCGKHGHLKCPLGHHNCMKSISAEEVFLKVKKLLLIS